MDDKTLRRERLLGKMQALQAMRKQFQNDAEESSKRVLSGQAQAHAHKKGIESIETLHEHLRQDDALDESAKKACHQWVDRSRHLVESLIAPLDLEVKMARGVQFYLQGGVLSLDKQIEDLNQELRALEQVDSDERITGTHPEPPIKKIRKSAKG